MWKNGKRHDAIDTLFNQYNRDKNIVLLFKAAERLVEDKQYKEAIDALNEGLLLVKTTLNGHPKAEELNIRLLLNLADISKQRHFYNEAKEYLNEAMLIAKEKRFIETIEGEFKNVEIERERYLAAK